MKFLKDLSLVLVVIKIAINFINISFTIGCLKYDKFRMNINNKKRENNMKTIFKLL